MEIIEINNVNELKNAFFQARYNKISGSRSRTFVAVTDGNQSGLLIYDEYGDNLPPSGFIMEINVSPESRKKQIATNLLNYAENISIKLKFNFIALDAYPLDHSINKEWLVSWYEKNGFVRESAEGDRMKKNLAASQRQAASKPHISNAAEQ